MKKGSSLSIMSCMIAFDIVHVVRLYLIEKLGYYPKVFLQVYVISVWRQMSETGPIDER